MLKDYELNVPERPYKIYWHGIFLRSYDNIDSFEQGLKFFNRFLLNVTFEKGELNYEI